MYYIDLSYGISPGYNSVKIQLGLGKGKKEGKKEEDKLDAIKQRKWNRKKSRIQNKEGKISSLMIFRQR